MADRPLGVRVALSIRAILADRQLTQEWLAEASGIPIRTLARRLHATHPSAMSLDELARIASALDLAVLALLSDDHGIVMAQGAGDGFS